MKKKLTRATVAAAGVCAALVTMTASPAAAGVPPEPPWTAPPTTVPTQPPTVETGQGLDVSSVALGALGAFTLAGAGLGITLGVQRRRDHAGLHTT
ncbi:hypothetical protein [Kribbella sp. NPDC050470]|uniref:hypothetical protein n=1 Tax=unclassified Kribbella TaxID=2644121 RepID=UPI003797FC08